MSPSAFIGLQFVQAPLDLPAILRRPPPQNANLKEIVRHGSVISAYLSGLAVTALIQTDVEAQVPERRKGGGGGRRDGEGGGTGGGGGPQEASTPAGDGVELLPEPPYSSSSSAVTSSAKPNKKSRILQNTIKLSLEAKCPVLQTSVCALVMPGATAQEEGGGKEKAPPPEATLPGLLPGRSQLDFQFAFLPSSPLEAEKTKEASIGTAANTLCNLLELGIQDASVTCVTKVIHSEINEEAILTWKNVQGFRLADPISSPRSDDYETKNNKVVIKASLPYLWSQLAAPVTGIPSPSTGGLDVLILSEVIDLWKPCVEQVIKSVETAIERKAVRDKSILLALLCGAARSPLFCKVQEVHTRV